MTEFKREIRFRPAFDKRSAEPGKNYGVHGVEMKWFLRGPLGTIQFVVSTNWMLPHVEKEMDARLDPGFPHLLCHPQPTDIGYHSPKPMYTDQSLMAEDCEYVEGGRCYYDGSSLQAEKVFQVLVEQGDEACWQVLEDRYRSTFKDIA